MDTYPNTACFPVVRDRETHGLKRPLLPTSNDNVRDYFACGTVDLPCGLVRFVRGNVQVREYLIQSGYESTRRSLLQTYRGPGEGDKVNVRICGVKCTHQIVNGQLL